MTISEPITRQIRRAQARQSHTEQTQLLTDKIMTPSSAATAKAKARSVSQGQLTDAELQAWQASACSPPPPALAASPTSASRR